MIVKLMTEHHLECLSLKGGCRGSSESTHVKMPQGWKFHALAQIICTSKRPSRSDSTEMFQMNCPHSMKCVISPLKIVTDGLKGVGCRWMDRYFYPTANKISLNSISF